MGAAGERSRARVRDRCPIGPGDVIDGKFVVDGVLGAGGMGVVVGARHIELGERVAIKLLVDASGEHVERFTREIRTIAHLRSEHVTRVLDAGKTADGVPYMVMEYLVGETLSARLARGPLDTRASVDIALQICEGLAEPHAAGIVHRDIKPANLFLVSRVDGRLLVKVLDFGIAKSLELLNQGALTTTSTMLGSPSYASPEQLTSPRDVDARSDIWAIGVVLYQVLAGVLPFKGETLAHLCMSVLSAPLPPLDAREHVPPQLARIIERCMEKDPAGRFADVGELATALEPFASDDARGSARRVRDTLAHGAAAIRPAWVESGLRRSADERRATPSATGDENETLGSTTREPAAPSASPRRGARWPLAAAPLAALATATLYFLAARGGERPKNDVVAAPVAANPVAAETAPPPSSAPAAPDVATTPVDSATTARTAPPRPATARPRPRAPAGTGVPALHCPGDPRCVR